MLDRYVDLERMHHIMHFVDAIVVICYCVFDHVSQSLSRTEAITRFRISAYPNNYFEQYEGWKQV